MKKLMILAVAVALAAVSQAASVTWQVSTGSAYANWNVYAYKGDITSSLKEWCASTVATDWTKVATVTPVVATTGTRGSASADMEGVALNDKLSFLMVNGAIAEGSQYVILNAATINDEKYLFTPPAAGTKFTVATSGQFASGTFTAGTVPEPTSGLLLVLGIAGLALRRRRA